MSFGHLVTTHEFWTGAIGSGLLTGGITFFSTRASDRRKFKHDNTMQDRKDEREGDLQGHTETREDRLREEQSLIAAAEDFTQICSEILVDTIDTEGAFNVIRDMLNNMAGKDDPVAEKKLAHAQKVADAQKRIVAPHYKLKLSASPDVVTAADKVVTSLFAVARMTTQPLAAVMAQKAAADEMNNFANVIRRALGKTEYTSDDSKKAVHSFLNTLQRQTDDFVEQARDEMKAAGFKTTPWDNYQRKTPTAPPQVI